MMIQCCYWEGWPVLVNEREAWAYINGAWKVVDRTEAWMKAAVVGEATFREMFGQLPPLQIDGRQALSASSSAASSLVVLRAMFDPLKA